MSGRALQSRRKLQVFQRGQIQLQGIAMAEIQQRLHESRHLALRVLAIPQHLTGFGGQQLRDDAQQAGLAHAVRTIQLQQLTSLQRKRHAPQQVMLATPQMQLTHFEQRVRRTLDRGLRHAVLWLSPD